MSDRYGGGPEGEDALARLKRSVVEHYESRLARYGATARGMDWKDEASQNLRFEVLSGICNLGGRSVHEVGAGAGHFVDYLASRGLRVGYSGSDLSAAMIKSARTRHPGVRFERCDILDGPVRESHDVILCSGLFHVSLRTPEDAWLDFVKRMVSRMFEMCRLGIAFNMLSSRVDYRKDGLYYSESADMLDFCRRELSPHVALCDDYPLYEYTLYVYRDPPPPGSGWSAGVGPDQPDADHAGTQRGGER